MTPEEMLGLLLLLADLRSELGAVASENQALRRRVNEVEEESLALRQQIDELTGAQKQQDEVHDDFGQS